LIGAINLHFYKIGNKNSNFLAKSEKKAGFFNRKACQKYHIIIPL
jgi:hypothetical protein